MIGYLKGQLLSVSEPGLWTLYCGEAMGVGYTVRVPARADYDDIAKASGRAHALELWIHAHVREDAFDLFGFVSPAEKQVFELLLSVSGVGPRSAIGILSGVAPDRLLSALADEDRTAFVGVPGVGKKTIERLMVELSEKVRKLRGAGAFAGVAAHASAPSRNLGFSEDEARTALAGLGFREAEFQALWKRSLETLDEGAGLEQFIRQALRREASL